MEPGWSCAVRGGDAVEEVSFGVVLGDHQELSTPGGEYHGAGHGRWLIA